jgi:hypothetical protein
MARTMSVSDDQTHITASMTVDDDGITELKFTASDGARVVAADLRLVALFGLQLPTTDAAPVVSAAAKNVITGKTPAPRTPSGKTPGRRNFNGRRPDDAALLRMWLDHDRSASAMARTVGCAASTIFGWISAAKARGTEFETTT